MGKASRPIQGYDVTVAVIDDNGAPTFAGEFQEIDIDLEHDPEEYQETNQRMPIYLDGDIKISGSLKRGWYRIDLVNGVWGQSKIGPDVAIQRQKRVTLTFKLNGTSSQGKGISGTPGMKLTGVLFTKTSLKVKNGKAIVDKTLTFKAEGMEDIEL